MHEQSYRRSAPKDAPIGAQNVGEVCVVQGELSEALRWSDLGVRKTRELFLRTEGVPSPDIMRAYDETHCLAARAHGLMGKAAEAREQFDKLQAIHVAAIEAIKDFNRRSTVPIDWPDDPKPIEDLLDGRPWCRHLVAGGDYGVAAQVAERRLTQHLARHGEGEESIEFRLLLAAAHLGTHNVGAAESQLEEAVTRASVLGDVPSLATGLYLQAVARLQRDELDDADQVGNEALRLARESGLGIVHIDALTLLAEVDLRHGHAQQALYRASTALYGQRALQAGETLYAAAVRDPQDAADAENAGIFPPPESGRPALLAATNSGCAYRRGEARARRAVAEARLLQAAVSVRRTSFAPDETGILELPGVEQAVEELQRSVELMEETIFPECHSANRELSEMRARLGALQNGVLTTYPIQSDVGAQSLPRDRPTRILVSYSHHDTEVVDRIVARLDLAFEHVWIDRRSVDRSKSIVAAINRALREITDYVLVYSERAKESRWVQNECATALMLHNSIGLPRIHPIVLDQSALPELLLPLSAIILPEHTFDDAMERLRSAIETHRLETAKVHDINLEE